MHRGWGPSASPATRAATVAVVVLLFARLAAGGSDTSQEADTARLEARTRLAKQSAAATAVAEASLYRYTAATKNGDDDDASQQPTRGNATDEEEEGLSVWRLDGGGRRWVPALLTGGASSPPAMTITTAQSLPLALSPAQEDPSISATFTTTRSYPPGSWLTQSQESLNVSASGSSSGSGGGGGGSSGEDTSYVRACATREPTSAELTAKESKRRVASIQVGLFLFPKEIIF
jgi:uncharacterized membrane protein YgcG